MEDSHFRHEPCPPGFECQCVPISNSSSDSSAGSGSESGPFSSSSDGASSTYGSTGSTAVGYECPATLSGTVTFTGLDLPDRQVYIESSGSFGPLSIYWYGTNQSIATTLNAWYEEASAIVRNETAAAGGVFVVPGGDPLAIQRPNGNIFPWWITGNAAAPEEETDRRDDFLLMRAVVDCLSGGYDPNRIVTSGHSAGGIMSSYLLAERDDIAGAVLWSGGMRWGEPMTPAGPGSAMVLHGGPFDVYTGPGAPTENPQGNPVAGYDFVQPSVNFNADMDAAGNFSMICNHQAGHSDSMGLQGAQFLTASRLSGHLWTDANVGNSSVAWLDWCTL